MMTVVCRKFAIHVLQDLFLSFGHVAHFHCCCHYHAISSAGIVSYQVITHLLLVSVITSRTNHL